MLLGFLFIIIVGMFLFTEFVKSFRKTPQKTLTMNNNADHRHQPTLPPIGNTVKHSPETIRAAQLANARHLVRKYGGGKVVMIDEVADDK